MHAPVLVRIRQYPAQGYSTRWAAAAGRAVRCALIVRVTGAENGAAQGALELGNNLVGGRTGSKWSLMDASWRSE